MRNIKISVLIPCYNESATIGKVIHDYKEVLPQADIYDKFNPKVWNEAMEVIERKCD